MAIERTKHNLAQKVHFPSQIEYRGKPDSVYIVCTCGYVDCVGAWYESGSPGTVDKHVDCWTDRNGVHMDYDRVIDVVRLYLGLIHPEAELIRLGLAEDLQKRIQRLDAERFRDRLFDALKVPEAHRGAGEDDKP